MPITKITSYLVFPDIESIDQPDIPGYDIPTNGRLYNVLNDIYQNAERECNLPLVFRMADDGTQQNDVRDEVVSYIGNPNTANANALKDRLTAATPRRKDFLALLFLILGEEGNLQKLLISRFPANTGILADITGENKLKVEIVERIFLRNEKRYKAALYEDESLDGGFWKGRAADKQSEGGANYWLSEYLQSDLETTSITGSRRLAKALVIATRKSQQLNIKNEIASICVAISSLDGQRVSINEITDRYNLQDESKRLISEALPNRQIANDSFVLNHETFSRNAPFKSIELDNGGVMVGPSDNFDDVFPSEIIDSDNQLHRFTTTGKIVNEKLKARKA